MSTKIFDRNLALMSPNFEESSLDESSFDEENAGIENGRRYGTQEAFGDNNGWVQLEVEDHSFKPVWKDDEGE